MSERNGIQQGNDIMLFVEIEGEGKTKKFVPTLAAKSHKISYKASTKDIVTKDTKVGKWTRRTVSKLDVNISCEGLIYAGTPKDGVTQDQLLAQLISGSSVKLRYGYKESKAGETCEEGMFVITSLERTSPADSEATYSAQFESDGEVKTVKIS